MQNDLLLRTIRGEKTERTPVWLMRQAGRILPEYRAVRNRISSFVELVKNPELACEVTLQPVDILGVDAAIIFSDILVVPEAMGLVYEMVEQRGPYFPETIETQADVDRLEVAPSSSCEYVYEAIRLTKSSLNRRVPLIGFAGAPFTIFCYMTEGKGSKTFSKARRLMYTQPDLCHSLLQKITDTTINYLKGQVAAGADVVQIFDSWAGILPPDHYTEFSLPYISQICTAISAPKIVFAKGAFFARQEFCSLDCQGVGLDWTMDIEESKQLMPNKVLQGNLDPCALYANPDEIKRSTRKMLDDFGLHAHIANLGHGVYPDIDFKNVQVFVEEVKSYSLKMRSGL
jgi:uroporphyrinogen decarboxylase